MRWNIESENHEFAATAFHAIVAANGLQVRPWKSWWRTDLDAARKILAEIDRLLPREPISGDTVLPIMFWHQGEDGVEATVRCVELVHWADLAPNYPGETRTRLAPLMEGFKPEKNDGRLLLWHGEPGTRQNLRDSLARVGVA